MRYRVICCSVSAKVWLTFATCMVVMSAVLEASDTGWASDFKKPPLELKSLPLWHLKGEKTCNASHSR